MSLPLCQCDAKAFIEKYRKELEIIFQSKYKNVVPVSESSEPTTLDDSEEHQETLYPSEITVYTEDDTSSEDVTSSEDELSEVSQETDVPEEAPEYNELLEVKEIEGIIMIAKVKEESDETVNPEVIMVIDVTEKPEAKEEQDLDEMPEIITIEEISEVPEVKPRQIQEVEEAAEVKVKEKHGVRIIPEAREIQEVKPRKKVKKVPVLKQIPEVKETHGVTIIAKAREMPEVKQRRKVKEVPEIKKIPEVKEIHGVTLISEIKEIPEVKQRLEVKTSQEVKDKHGVTIIPDVREIPEGKQMKIKEVPEIKKISEVKKAPEVNVVSKVKEKHEVTSIPEIKEVPDVKVVSKIMVKEVPEVKVIPGIKEVPEVNVSKIKEKHEATIIPEIKEVPDAKVIQGIKEVPEVKKSVKEKEVQGIKQIPEVKDKEEVKETVGVSKIPEVKKEKGIKDISEIQQIKEQKVNKSLEVKMGPKDVPEVKKVNEVKEVPEVKKVNEIKEVPEIKKVLKVKTNAEGTPTEHRTISFSEKIQVINLPTPPSRSVSCPNSDAFIEMPPEEIISITVLTPQQEVPTLKKTVLERFSHIQNKEEFALNFPIEKKPEVPTLKKTILDRFTHIQSKDEVPFKRKKGKITEVNEEYFRRDSAIKADKKKIINMLLIIEENVFEASSGISKKLLKYLKMDMNDVQDLFREVKNKEIEIEKIEKIQIDIDERERSDTEIWNLIQELSKSIESLPVRKQIVQPDIIYEEEMEEEEISDKHSKDLFGEQTEISGEDFSEEELNEQENFYTDILEISDDYNPRTKEAAYYLKSRKIYQFFRYLGAHLVVAQPENPIAFLVDLLDRFCKYRYDHCCPPLLFEKRHVESVYNSLDPMHYGEITLDQYYNGLFSLGLYKYKGSHNQHIMIERDIFISDACRKLKEQLDKMLYFPGQSLMVLSPVGSTRSRTSSFTRSG